MTTPAEIRNQAAKKLGLYGTGQTLQSEISAAIDAAYAEVFNELEAMSLTTWDVADEVPEHLTRPVVALVAMSRVNEYSVPTEKYNRIVREAHGDPLLGLPSAIDRIRQMLARPKMGQTEIENF